VTALALAAGLAIPDRAVAFHWPWEGNPWPSSSDLPVVTLDHPTVEEAEARGALAGEYRFAAFGDQRALADGEWQEMLAHIAAVDETRPLAFVLDTGDIVDDGSHADQFHMLEGILEPVADIPYLVGIGNHELDDNRTPVARVHTAEFLAYLDPDLSPERLWYRKDLGAATFLFLDTNDFTYGIDGDRRACPLSVEPGTREAEQLDWLRAQAAELGGQDRLVIAVMHHPIVQSSEKHREAACSLWNFRDNGEGLADLLADAGVDVVLTGHTHTYERFRLVRSDGREMDVVNLSGRPRDAFLWIGSGDRRARDIRGREEEVLDELGWLGLDHWQIHQEDVMLKDEEADQFAVVTIEPTGGVLLEVCFLDDDAPGGVRRTGPDRLR